MGCSPRLLLCIGLLLLTSLRVQAESVADTGNAFDADTAFACTWAVHHSSVLAGSEPEPCKALSQQILSMQADPLARSAQMRLEMNRNAGRYREGMIEEFLGMDEDARLRAVASSGFMVNFSYILSGYAYESLIGQVPTAEGEAEIDLLYQAYMAQADVAARKDLPAVTGSYAQWYIARGNFQAAVDVLAQLAHLEPGEQAEVLMYAGMAPQFPAGSSQVTLLELMEKAFGPDDWRTGLTLMKLVDLNNQRAALIQRGGTASPRNVTKLCKIMLPTVKKWMAEDAFANAPKGTAYVLGSVAGKCFSEGEYEQSREMADYLVARKATLREIGDQSIYVAMYKLAADTRLALGDYAELRAFYEADH